jgi:hypothetical protein
MFSTRSWLVLASVLFAVVLVAPVGAQAATLHDQFDNQATGTGSSTPSYFYENGTGDEQAADDFTVPPGQAWQVTNVQVPGPDYSGTFTFRSTIYADTGAMPGSPVFQGQATIPAGGTTYTLPLSGAPQLRAGHYWISVQAMNLINWNWVNRTVQSGSPAMWQNPDGTDNPSCVTWGLRTQCEAGTSAFPDQAFALIGDSVPVSAPKKCKKHKKHKRSAESAKKKKCKKKKKR